MKRSNGFTLVEMLGVMIILVVIFMIMFPSLTKMIKNTNDNIDNATLSVIEDAVTDFLTEKNDVYPKEDEYTYCISLTELVDNNDLTEKEISTVDNSDMVVKASFVDNKPTYVLTENCTAVSGDVDFTLLDEKNLSFEVGDGGQYVEPGAVAKNKDGSNASYTTTITNPNKETVAYVDTTKKGIYTVKYSAVIDGKNRSIERIVRVVDTTAPTINVNPVTDMVAINNNTYNVLDGVTAYDNSGETVPVKVSTNLSLGQAGTYSVTYTAEDTSGNREYARRTVVITAGQLVTLSIGATSVTREINSGAYVDTGVTAQDALGNDLTSEITKIVKKGGVVVPQVDVSKLGTYYVTYSITKANVKYSETKTVIINDTIAPVISGASDTNIYSNNMSFNIMTGVTATDNSGETITINTTSNLTLGVVGSYTVTYTATDSSGNSSTSTRHINVIAACAYSNGQTWVYSYTGNSQSFTIPCNGTYKLEVWGAQGGYASSSYGTGGLGGYSAGNAAINKDVLLYIYVGGAGTSTSAATVAGGYNGGGAGRYYGGSGGGSTDIRISGTTLYYRVIVAGGGGGTNGRRSVSYMSNGGYGGGTTAGDGTYTTATHNGKAGTQTAGGAAATYSATGTPAAGTYGTGGQGGYYSTSYGAGGGGGGWYGGGGGAGQYGAGGGGSGFIWTAATASNAPGGYLVGTQYYLSSATTIAGNASMPNTSGSTETGHAGNGYARITLVSSN